MTDYSWVHHMGLRQDRCSTHLRSNPLYTCMIKNYTCSTSYCACSFDHALACLSRSSFAFSSIKLALIMQQGLTAQIGLYRCDEWVVQEINDENLMLTQFNVS